MNSLRDPFNPESGEFAKNIRAITGLDDTELRQSLKNYGWLKELPAIMDENGVVLVGHRRLRLAKPLNIEPVIQTIKIGKGDEADSYRLKLAIASNIGQQPLTKDDRKRIAEYLYGKREWTMEKIADALDVNQATVTRDLEGLCTTHKPSRPKGGRPKGSGQRNARPKQTDALADKIIALADKGVTSPEIAAEIGVDGRAVRHVIERERIRREAKAEPDIDLSEFSMTVQQKLEAWKRQHAKKLALEFEPRVRAEVRKQIDEMVLPHWKQQIKEAKTLYDRRRALMDKATFNKIRRGLHPDSRNSISDKMLGEAFDAFMALEKFLLNEKDSPTTFHGIPNDLAEWDKMRVKKRTRSGVNSVQPRH